MERIRLTQRMANRERQADSAVPPTSIDLGKERTYRKIDEYHTFEPSLNHWEPDMRHEWQDNPREETGHGIPKTAKVYMAAKKATKLAMLLLGDNALEADIENQAKAFMRMGDKALTASIDRWAAVNAAGAAPAAPAPAPAEAPAEAPAAPAPAPVPAEACDGKKACGKKANTALDNLVNSDDEAPAPAPAPAAPAEAPAEAPAPAPTEGDDETAPAVVEEAPAAPAEDGSIDVGENLPATEIEFDDGAEEPAGSAADADAELAACFTEDESAEPAPATAEGTTASRKAGLKRLAGQPTLVRVASKKASDELTSLWDNWSNPGLR